MCGRFAQDLSDIELAELTNISKITPVFRPRYNIAPSQKVLILRKENDKIEFIEMTWGLLPSWAKVDKALKPQINARSETASEKPMFRNSFNNKRCVIPASGFYEWKKSDTKKTPFYIKAKDNKPLLLAGLWDSSYLGDSFTILTCEANSTMKPLHDRMPVILDPRKLDTWFNEIHVKNLLDPAKDDLLESYEVSSLVNSPKNDSHNCIDRV